MGGGLMQLVAYGAQDVYLTGNPQITFWKVTYRRHTNFAVESIEQTFNGQADFGRRVTCTISRNGDLAYRTYLQVVLPEINQGMRNPGDPGFIASLVDDVKGVLTDEQQGELVSRFNAVYARWLDYPGEQLISQVEVEIGGQRIDRQYGDWMHIWNQLTLTSEQERGYNAMVGQTVQLTYITDPAFANVDGPCDANAPQQVCAPRNALPETTLYVPLQFWYCRNPGLALPLIALQYHEVKINLDLRPIDECLWALSSISAPTSDILQILPTFDGSCEKVRAAYAQSLVAASLYVDYVFLDTDERRRMAQNPHEYLIEQLQFTGDESVGSSSNKIKLNFNHPVKELVWVVQPDENVDYCASFVCGECLNNVFGAQPFNYTDAVDALPNAFQAFGSMQELAGVGPLDYNVNVGEGGDNFLESCNFEQAGAGSPTLGSVGGIPGSTHGETFDGIPLLGNKNVPNNTLGGKKGFLEGLAGLGTTLGVGNGKLFKGRVTDAEKEEEGKLPGFDDLGPGDAMSIAQALQSLGQIGAGGSTVSDAGTFVLAQTALDLHCWGQNPVVTAKLQLNGQDRFSEREGTYFDLVQPYQHHTRNPDTGINVYSFALRPEEHQPSGSCNFSRIDNATLQLVLSNATVSGTKTAKVRVYATNYNVLRVMSGMGGLAYSN
jgi:hypothetical protein